MSKIRNSKSKTRNPKSEIRNTKARNPKPRTQSSTAGSSSPWQVRPNDGQGPFTSGFNKFVPRKVEADFYEFLREGIPIIDAAINRLVSLDGHIVVKGNKDALVKEIQEWVDFVPVNDIQKGVQAFHQNFTNEAFEQGFGLSEYLTDKKRTDIIGLRVADSKFIKFQRTVAGLDILQKADEDREYRPLNPANLMYFSINNENQNPNGTSLMRSCEFTGKVFATIINSIGNVWERFGDPSYSIIYKTSKRDGADHQKRVKSISEEFEKGIKAKREGKSADFIRAIDKDSDIIIKIIGADGQVLDAEVPARIILEQIIAKTGLPPWMLGVHWSTTERLSNAEAAMLLADVATRQAAKMPLFYNLIRTMLLLRGRTWKDGDWWLEWGQVNLYDQVQQAQARFLHAQADMYYLQNAASAGIEINRSDLYLGQKAAQHRIRPVSPHSIILPGASTWSHYYIDKYHVKAFRGEEAQHPCCGQKEVNRSVPWPALDAVESEYESILKADWAELQAKTFEILKLPQVKAADKITANGAKGAKGAEDAGEKQHRRHVETHCYASLRGGNGSDHGKADPLPDGLPNSDAFTFSDEQRAAVMSALKNFIGKYDWRESDSPVRWYYGQSYSLGLIQAARMVGKELPLLNIIKNKEIFEQMIRTGFDLVKNNATLRIHGNIMAEMEAQMLAGTNPLHVAGRLKKLFGNANSDWERLARSEMSMAAETAKVNEWDARGIDVSNSVIAVKDTHPKCKCANSIREIDGVLTCVFTPAPDACAICQALAQ